MNYAIDNWNYANDARTQGAAKKPVLYYLGCRNCGETEQECACGSYEEVDLETALPMKWAVCPVGEGEGKHVNPSIDAGVEDKFLGAELYDRLAAEFLRRLELRTVHDDR